MRSCGVLLHISSLPGTGGVGTLGAEAREFVDFLDAAGQSWWQVLPLTPPARGNSPYSSYSVFAGNPAFINLELLEEEGLLSDWTRKFMPRHTGERANFDFCRKVHLPLLRQTYQTGYRRHRKAVDAFRKKHAFWLEDYALFMALKKKHGDIDFHEWPRPLLLREPAAIAAAREELAGDIGFWIWVQYLFFRQWRALKKYANGHGVGIIGDMPIYADSDSADAWAGGRVFLLDENRRQTQVAGVPPDFFSEDGQLWGNPLYDWDYLKSTGFRWWIERLRHASAMYDMVRVDHFRALDEYYAVPAGETTARGGAWMLGPGMSFLNAVREAVPECKLIAEDLGVTTKSLKKLLLDSGLPGMKVLQFAFDPERDSEFLPHNFHKNCVGYTGTHDNDTTLGWYRSAPAGQVRFAREYLRLTPMEGVSRGFIRGLYATPADTVIVPVQDWLGMSSTARMNLPGTAEGNWGWRVSRRALSSRLAEEMRALAQLYRRLPGQVDSQFEEAAGK